MQTALSELIDHCHSRKYFSLKSVHTPEEIQRCISFRESLFFGENNLNSCDREQRDESAGHIQIIDTRTNEVIGYLRLISNTFGNSTTKQPTNFYSSEFYQLEHLHQHFARGMEISRFCVLPKYRKHPAIFLLVKQLILLLVEELTIDVLFGVASFEQASITQHQHALAYLKQHSTPLNTPSGIVNIQSSHESAVDIHSLPNDTSNGSPTLPPLLRFYLHFKPTFSDHFILDSAFDSTLIFLYVTKEALLNRD